MGFSYELLNQDNPVFLAYCFWTGLLVIKLLMMAFLTGINRFRKKVFANPEDAMGAGMEVRLDDPDVERVRRAHLNDLENLVPFFIIGFLYVLTDPNKYVAVNLYRIIGVARVLHTIVYAVYPIRQPARFICFFAALVPTIFMAIWVMVIFVHP